MSIATSVGCDQPIRAELARNASNPGTALVVDSILARGEALKRFQAGLPTVTRFEGGAGSRDELVSRFIAALQADGTARFGQLKVSRAEYAFLYFPASAYNREPYDLPPEVAWFLSAQNSRKGLMRLRQRLGGQSLRVRGYQCPAVTVEGPNRFWRSCAIAYADPVTARPIIRKLFGAIMEHGGRYKFLSYANDF